MKKTKEKELILKDKKYTWHPFTQMKDWVEEDVLLVERGEGNYLIDASGNKYLDGVSSLWCNVHGHNIKELNNAISKQLKKIAHSTFLGLSHPEAIYLSEKLVEITPKKLTRVFYSDSGSEAVEVAIKMAYQYWQQKKQKKKTKFAKLSNSYHGDTLGSVSVGGIELFHELYSPLLFETYEIPSPYSYRWKTGSNPQRVLEESLDVMEKTFKERGENIAAFVMEPMMQGAAGMINQPKGYISRARELTKKYNILLIFDEVATGFGRTGKMFASEHENVAPDLMTVAKGLTGGYLPLAATLTTEEIYNAFLGKAEELKTFFHGHTYTANPLACSVSLASIKLFEKNKILQKIQNKISVAEKWLKKIRKLNHVGDVRQSGMMIGVELVKEKRTREAYSVKEKIGVKVIRKAREKGVILRPLGNVIVLMPPLSIKKKELEKLFSVTEKSIEEITEK